jgi:two-component system, NarL family, response regulator DevR
VSLLLRERTPETPGVTDPEAPSTPLRVLVVDSDERVRDSLAALLCIGERCAVVGSAPDPELALAIVAASRPDVVILDPRTADPDGGRTFITRLRALDPSIRVVVMSRSDDGEATALAAGADAFVRKTFRARELIDAVLAAGRGVPS